jgi:replicative DNA helicase
VAVADDLGTAARAPQQPEFDRQPPQDLQAEQSVLGGMLLSKDAIADVVEVLRSTDFYRPAHQTLYDTILDLYGRGEPADPVTVSAELTRNGQLLRVGGTPYLHTLISSVPTAANAGFYAEIVAERATLRRLVEAGTRIVQLGYGAAGGQGGDVDEVVDRAQAEIYDVTERRSSEDYVRLEQLLQGTMDEIDAISSRGGASIGVPTGFSELDQITNGLHPGQMVIVAARPAIGKALALDTPLPTPAGWTTMGEVAVGDCLLGADGRPTTVVAATEVMYGRPCYEVEFSDGTVIVADAEHQWRTTTRAARRARSERLPSRLHFPHRSVDRAQEVAARAAVEAERLVTRKELVGEVGEESRAVVHTVALRMGPAGEVVTRASGPLRSFDRRTPAYSRRGLSAALAARVSRPMGASQVAEHPEIVTTEQMARTLRCSSADRRPNHAVALTAPLALPEADLPVPPYTLGAWLGDGTSDAARLTTADPEIVAQIEADGFQVTPTAGRYHYSIRLPERPAAPTRRCVVCDREFRPATTQVHTCGRSCGGRSSTLGLPPAPAPTCTRCAGPATTGFGPCAACHARSGSVQALLRGLGVLNDKHIPASYLRASEAQRRALLAGLLDTGGTVSPNGTVVFAVTDRRLAEDVRELVLGLGYRATISTKPARGRTAESSVCYSLCFTPADPVFRLPRKLARQKSSVRTADRRYVVDVRPVPSVPVRCVQVDNDGHLYLASRSMVPTHNSTLALDFSRACSIKQGLTSVIFSLEMSKSEITMRLLSAEAKVPLHHMRSGHMSDDDWARLARRMGEVADAPLYIDDSPNMTMMEIRAKARRLRQRHDLRLVVVDYMQLMTSGKRVESRQVEVSEFSRSLKLLAKELEVPVVAISQLNRGPEQRTDKKPMLSDLRESGCLPASVRVWRADTGAEVSLGELLESGARDVPVWSLDDKLRLTARPMTDVFSSGRKEVFRLHLTSGRTVDATANHPFLTYDGWRPLGDLEPGARLAVPRAVPPPLDPVPWPEAEVVLLAHLIGDGSFVRRQPIRYASVDEANLSAVTEAARQFGVRAVRDDHAAARCTSLRLPAPFRLTHGRRNPIAAWLDGLGLFGLRSPEKFVPAGVFALPDDQLASFLRHLWATDGSVGWHAGQARVYYASTSRRLVDDLARLLLRFGVLTRCKTVRKSGYRDGYHLQVTGAENQLRFLDRIGVHGARARIAVQVAERLRAMVGNTNLDTVPREVWDRVREVLSEQSMTHRQFAAAMETQFCGSTLWKHAPSRARLARGATLLRAADLEMLATNDVFWDEVASVESLGEQEVYDATVLGTHNFLADGIAVHNSLEQDADMVILLHREDAYERESPRAGEADLILAKHRNGPTGLVTVAFQGHYSRFVDMAT